MNRQAIERGDALRCSALSRPTHSQSGCEPVVVGNFSGLPIDGEDAIHTGFGIQGSRLGLVGESRQEELNINSNDRAP